MVLEKRARGVLSGSKTRIAGICSNHIERSWGNNENMSNSQIEPHKVQKPIQLLAVWFAALVLLDSAFLAAAATVSTPGWVPPLLAIAAVVFVPVFLVLAFVMQTKYRTHLQDDEHFSKWLKDREEQFASFRAENIVSDNDVDRVNVVMAKGANVVMAKGAAEEPEQRRIAEYEDHRGLFVVHDWVPSKTKGQVADVRIWLHQHGSGPMSHGKVSKVEYHLGPKFFNGKPVVKTDASDAFRLEISAYGPVLCLARVYIQEGEKTIELMRYVDFEMAPEQSAAYARGTAGAAPRQ